VSRGEAVEPLVDPWIPVCLLCRFFVALLSDFTPPDGWRPIDLVRPSILHMLGTGFTTAEFAVSFYVDLAAREIALEALHEFGERSVVGNAHGYRLKNEHENSVTPFWICFTLRDFLNFVSRAADARAPHLLSLPRIDERNVKRTGRFTKTAPFLDFIVNSIHIFDAQPDQANTAAYFALMALIQMVGEVSQRLETTAPIEALASANVFDELAKVVPIRQPLISLMAHIKSIAPALAGRLDALYSSLSVVAPPRRSRSNREAILAQFTAARTAFEETLDEADINEESSELICVACREPIDMQSQVYVLKWSGRFPTMCSHYIHHECASRLPQPFCPLCRRDASFETPILRPGYTEAQKTSASEALDYLIDQTAGVGIERSLRQIGQWLEFDPEASMPDAFKKLIQSIIITSTDWKRRREIPLLYFASQLSSAVSVDDFDRFLHDAWPAGSPPLKSAAILWNSWVEWAGNSLPMRPLAAIPADSCELFLKRLPTQFSDLFTGAFFGRAMTGTSHDFCCCLQCGQLMEIRNGAVPTMEAHGVICGAALIMMITGRACTVLATLDFAEEMGVPIAPLYLTEAGDESVGFALGLPLVLSESRRRTVISEFLTGHYNM
jgi:hypothetical protein